jgi:acetoin utilization protein AcuB
LHRSCHTPLPERCLAAQRARAQKLRSARTDRKTCREHAADRGFSSWHVFCTSLSSSAMQPGVPTTPGTSAPIGDDLVSKPIPSIQKYMTTQPHTIGSDQSIAKAASFMTEFGIRHLPVLRGGRLLGVLSDRDIKLIESFRDVDATKTNVEEAMTEQPYTVDPDVALDEVVRTMAEKKFGSAVVMQNHKVVGIFTTVDACRALAELLQTRLAK